MSIQTPPATDRNAAIYADYQAAIAAWRKGDQKSPVPTWQDSADKLFPQTVTAAQAQADLKKAQAEVAATTPTPKS